MTTTATQSGSGALPRQLPDVTRTGTRFARASWISRVRVRRWARRMTAPGRAVIVDVETTGFDGAVVEIAVLDAATGAVLLDTLVDPVGAPNRGRILAATGRIGADPQHLADPARWGCVMRARTTVAGTRRHLPLGGGHRAAGDCAAARAVLITMTGR